MSNFGQCNYAEMDWCCQLPEGHEGAHKSARLLSPDLMTPSPTPTGEELRPCPFCGGNDLAFQQHISEDKPKRAFAWAVWCRDCNCFGRSNFPIGWVGSKIVAREAWNTRSSDKELTELRMATCLCDKHQPVGGAKSKCVICSGLELQAALSRIDYLCGEPNEMQVSSYDLHCSSEEVVKRVAGLIAAIERLRPPGFHDVEEFYKDPTDEPGDDCVNGELAELRKRVEEGQKDYEDMRRFQKLYIDADHELRTLKSEVGELFKLKERVNELEQNLIGSNKET